MFSEVRMNPQDRNLLVINLSQNIISSAEQLRTRLSSKDLELFGFCDDIQSLAEQINSIYRNRYEFAEQKLKEELAEHPEDYPITISHGYHSK